MEQTQWLAEQRRIRAATRARRFADRAASPRSVLASVVVACRDEQAVIGRCLAHLLEQDHENYEIIVVDDGSGDGTREIAQRLLGGGRGQLIVAGRRHGLARARNLGLRHARGEIVAFLDADGYAAPDWLREVVAAFAADEDIGAVASTVFYADNPLVINGAGGTVNRQGWAADLSINQSYEHAELASDALYAMGCGMALRRSAAERVGPFDERIVNYYDDVDYGIRLRRAGYRVLVSPRAWVDHDLGDAGEHSARKQLQFERHRMRVVLKHWPRSDLGRWLSGEACALRAAPAARRAVKLRALAWNLRSLPSTLASRRSLRAAAALPQRLLDASWGEAFPAGVPERCRPRPALAGAALDMADARAQDQLVHGWFPRERAAGRTYRWAGGHASALVRLSSTARVLRLDYAHAPVDTGGVEVSIRPLGSGEELAAAWTTHLAWRFLERAAESHPLTLPAGDYEVLLAARSPWRDPPRETRSLGLTVASMRFEESYEIAAGGVDMAAPGVQQQLVRGWFEPEQLDGRSYRWASTEAAVAVRLASDAAGARLSYRFPPGSIGELRMTVSPLAGGEPVWSGRIPWVDDAWREESLPLALAAGEYLVRFEAHRPWSNPAGRDPAFWPENRDLGFALSALSFS